MANGILTDEEIQSFIGGGQATEAQPASPIPASPTIPANISPRFKGLYQPPQSQQQSNILSDEEINAFTQGGRTSVNPNILSDKELKAFGVDVNAPIQPKRPEPKQVEPLPVISPFKTAGEFTGAKLASEFIPDLRGLAQTLTGSPGEKFTGPLSFHSPNLSKVGNLLDKIWHGNRVSKKIEQVVSKVAEPTRTEVLVEQEDQSNYNDLIHQGKWAKAGALASAQGMFHQAVGLLKMMMLGSILGPKLPGSLTGKLAKNSDLLKFIVPGLSGTNAETVKIASQRAIFSYLTEAGSDKDKSRSAFTTFLIMTTPIAARKLGRGVLAGVTGLMDLGLNSVLDYFSEAYPQVWEESKKIAKDNNNPESQIGVFISKAIPIFLGSTLGAAGTRADISHYLKKAGFTDKEASVVKNDLIDKHLLDSDKLRKTITDEMKANTGEISNDVIKNIKQKIDEDLAKFPARPEDIKAFEAKAKQRAIEGKATPEDIAAFEKAQPARAVDIAAFTDEMNRRAIETQATPEEIKTLEAQQAKAKTKAQLEASLIGSPKRAGLDPDLVGVNKIKLIKLMTDENIKLSRADQRAFRISKPNDKIRAIVKRKIMDSRLVKETAARVEQAGKDIPLITAEPGAFKEQVKIIPSQADIEGQIKGGTPLPESQPTIKGQVTPPSLFPKEGRVTPPPLPALRIENELGVKVVESSNKNNVKEVVGKRASLPTDLNDSEYVEVKDVKTGKTEIIKKETTAKEEVDKVNQSGFVLGDIHTRIAKKVRSLLSTTKGVAKSQYDAAVAYNSLVDSVRFKGAFGEAIVKDLYKITKKYNGKAETKQALNDVLTGDMTVIEFQRKFMNKIPAETRKEAKALFLLQQLNEINKTRAKTANAVSAIFEKLGEPELAKVIKGNPFYLTRFYQKFVMGENFTPKEADVAAAVDLVKASLDKSITKLETHLRIARSEGLDIDEYLRTGNQDPMKNYDTEAKMLVQSIGTEYQKLKALIINKPVVKGDIVTATANVKALQNAAESIINEHLEGGVAHISTGGRYIDISNLQKRTLESPVFKKLYGEVTKPWLRLRKSLEVQGGILAQHAFMDKLFIDGEGTVWSTLRDDAGGYTVRVGGKGIVSEIARKRYGELAGRYVSPEIARLIGIRTEATTKIGRVIEDVVVLDKFFRGVASLEKRMKLLGYKAIARNYTTALLQFSLGNGDMFLKHYFKHFAYAHKLMFGLMVKDPKAIKQFIDISKNDVFRTGALAIIDDLNHGYQFGTGRVLQKSDTAYAFIDFPTKYAAYMARMQDDSMNEKQAAAHVNRFYQYNENVPRIVGNISGFAWAEDYFTYKYVSTRILINQMAYLRETAQNKDWANFARATTGFAAARSLWLATSSSMLTFFASHWPTIKRALVNANESDDITDVEYMGDERMGYLRTFLAPYYKNEVIIPMIETHKDGSKVYSYAVVGSGSIDAFPAENIFAGALQASKGKGTAEFFKNIGRGLIDEFGVGMLPETIQKVLFKDSYRTEEKGLFPLFGTYSEQGSAEFVLALKNSKAISKTFRSFAPKALDSVWGVYDAYQNDKKVNDGKDPYKSTRSGKDTLYAMAQMVRVYNYKRTDINLAIVNAVKKHTKILSTYKKAIRDAKESPTNKKLQEEARIAQARRIAQIETLTSVVRSAKGLDKYYTDSRIIAILDDGGLTKKEATAVVKGNIDSLGEYVPRDKNKSRLQRLSEGHKIKFTTKI